MFRVEMKPLLLFTLCTTFLLADVAFARTIEVEVHGMTCPFCVDSLERKFKKMDAVDKVQVSLKMKTVRLETDENLPTIETIKQAVLDAGFTPTKIIELDETD